MSSESGEKVADGKVEALDLILNNPSSKRREAKGRSRSTTRSCAYEEYTREGRNADSKDLSEIAADTTDKKESAHYDSLDKENLQNQKRCRRYLTTILRSGSKSKDRSVSEIRRNAFNSFIVNKDSMNSSHRFRRESSSKKPVYDSDFKEHSASAFGSSSVSTSTNSAIFSSPCISDYSKCSSSSRSSRSPELSVALRLKHERIRRERDLNETRSILMKHHLGKNDQINTHKIQERDEDVDPSSLKPAITREKSEDMARLRNSEKLLHGKGSSTSLGPIRDVEDRHTGRRHRSRSDKDRADVTYENKATSPRISPGRVKEMSTSKSEKSMADSNRSRNRLKNRKDQGFITGQIAEPDSQYHSDNSVSDAVNLTLSRCHTGESNSLRKPYLELATAQVTWEMSSQSRSKTKHRSSQDLSNVDMSTPSSENMLPLDLRDSTLISNQSANTQNTVSKTYTNSTTQNNNVADESLENQVITTNRSSGEEVETQTCMADNAKITSASAEDIEKRANMATSAILRDGLADIPSLEHTTESTLLDWRAVFRSEMIRLRKEVNDFRQFCQTQIELQALALANARSDKAHVQAGQQKNGLRCQEAPRITENLKEFESKMQLLHRQNHLVDLEAELDIKEKSLAKKQKDLEEYEKEILEVEAMLNHRQTICDRRQKALLTLDEELQSLRQELEETKDQIQSEGSIPESNSERARRNWDTVRRNLMDKQHLLETTVQKYRSELAAATSTIAGKDILIARLQGTIIQHQQELTNKDKRMKQLDSKLTSTLSEAKALSEQLSGHSHRDSLGAYNSTYATENSSDHLSTFSSRRSSQELTPDYNKVSFRNILYRRPSNNAGSEPPEDLKLGMNATFGDHSTSEARTGTKIVRKRNNSVCDNAITRMTLSTPRSEDKFERGSSACLVQ